MAEPGKAYSEDKDPKAKWSSAPDTISADIRAAASRMVADSRIPGSSLRTLLNVPSASIFLGRIAQVLARHSTQTVLNHRNLNP
jgi:hypothetical protein